MVIPFGDLQMFKRTSETESHVKISPLIDVTEETKNKITVTFETFCLAEKK